MKDYKAKYFKAKSKIAKLESFTTKLRAENITLIESINQTWNLSKDNTAILEHRIQELTKEYALYVQNANDKINALKDAR